MKALLSVIVLFASLGLNPTRDAKDLTHYIIKVTSLEESTPLNFGASYILNGEGHHEMAQLDMKTTPFQVEVDATVLYFIAHNATPDVTMKVEMFERNDEGDEIAVGQVTSKTGAVIVIDYEEMSDKNLIRKFRGM